MLLWGAVAFGNVPGLQVYVVQQAERFAPRAVDVASGLNIAAFNLGIAARGLGGGLIVTHLGLMHTPWIGAAGGPARRWRSPTGAAGSTAARRSARFLRRPARERRPHESISYHTKESSP